MNTLTKANAVRARVNEFYAQHAIGNSAADAFPAWWLWRRFEIAPLDAVSLCSNGPGDKGIDGFYLEAVDGKPVLHLVQAKLSDSRSYLRTAVTGFEDSLPPLRHMLENGGLPHGSTNPVLTRLAARIVDSREHARSMRINFVVLHLCGEDEEAIHRSMTDARERFERRAIAELGDYQFTLSFLGPHQFDPGAAASHVPGAPCRVRFSGAPLETAGAARYYAGIGRLADLVSLYRQYGDYLFSKNVRMYLHKAGQQGPGRHLRETLSAITVAPSERAMPAEHFAMFHNGVTLYAQTANFEGDSLVVRKPSVLNGCQSVKNAFLFFEDPAFRGKIDAVRWESIQVPLRVVVSSDEDFVRRVAVANNRQTALRPSAFRANDPLQLRLGERFRSAGVFYERQEGAFDNFKAARPDELAQDFGNSVEAAVTMEDLAQAVALVLDRPALSVATKETDLFEDAQYRAIFRESNLENLTVLVFLRNLLKVSHLVLKDLREKSSRLEPLVPSRFRYPFVRMMARYVARYEPAVVRSFGREVYGRFGPGHELRAKLLKLAGPHQSGMQQLFPEIWGSEDGWRSATEKECIQKALRKLRVDSVSALEVATE
ncbi:MAG: hypothetical protein HOW73_18120 [Polyangiaceae bacterium]|nr:hypothetical protein [Polyangiaceae bacterium]